MDKNELKVIALRERIAQLTAEYEDKVADLRVALTISEAEKEELINQIKDSNEKKDEDTSK